MSLPIVLGGRSVSSKQLPAPNPHPEDAADGVALEPVQLFQTVAVCVCPKKEWLVRTSLSFYDLLRPDGKRETTMVEVRIEVSPLARPLSSSYRETVHHLKLPDGAQDEYPQNDPCAIVSPDRRNLAVLLFHPHKQSSALIIFQLRTPRADSNLESSLPLPSYISDSTRTTRACPMVATNPRFVSAWGVTAICNVPNVSPPLLLCSCQDGHLAWIDYRSSLTVATGEMDHAEVTRDLVCSATCLERGTMVAIHFNGVATISTWKIEKPTQLTLIRRASTGGSVVKAPIDSPSSSSEKSFNGGSSKKGASSTATAATSVAATASAAAKTTMNILSNFGFATAVEQEKAQTTEPVKEKQKQDVMDRFALEQIRKTTGRQFRRIGSKRRVLKGKLRRRSDHGNRDDTKRHMELDDLVELENVYSASLLGSSSCNLFAVLYRPGSTNTDRGTPCAAEVFGVLGDGQLRSMAQLELAPERVGELQVEMAIPVEDFSEWGGEEDDFSIQTAQVVKSNKYGLDYSESTGCLAVSTTYYVSSTDRTMQSLGCVWNWRANVVGLMLASSSESLHSRLYFANDTELGPHLVHIDVTVGKRMGLQKQTFVTGVLSPPSSVHGTQVEESSSILLAGQTVSLPVCSQPTVEEAMYLKWMESIVPTNYVSAYGPPQIAAIGRQQALNLAVASSSGVCILDVELRRWRLFGSETEERAFSVCAMTWWEGWAPMMESEEVGLEHESDDLLVAIIQSINGRQYLSCWSPKRLDLAHQLLEPAEQHADEGSWGMLLPKNITATSLSILAEPSHSGPRRAVVLVSTTNFETNQIHYVAFQLQVVQKENGEPAESYVEQKPYSVYAKASSDGIIKDGLRIAEPITAVFLASASFRFDLARKAGADDPDRKSPQSNEFIATLGVIRTPGGFDAVCLCSRGPPLVSPVADWDETSRYWLSDVVCSDNMTPAEILPGAGMDVFVWTIQLMDGELIAWSVPFQCAYHSEDVSLQSSIVLDEDEENHAEICPPPRQVCNRNMRNKHYGPMLGVTCVIGSSSDWMFQSSSGIQTDLPMGEVPGSSFGCILSTGQSSRKFHRPVPEGLDATSFAPGFLDVEIYCPNDVMMKPPAFVTSLYALVLEVAYLRAELAAGVKPEKSITSNLYHEVDRRVSLIEMHVIHRLASNFNKDAVFMALRLLVLRAVETLAGANKKYSKDETKESNGELRVARSLFKQSVDFVRQCTTLLQFASLFLEVGRQVEPSVFDHLFPLPMSSDKLHGRQNMGKEESSLKAEETPTPDVSVADLVALCISEGSVSASASALPLLGARRRSRKHCEELLRRSLNGFAKNAVSLEISRFDYTEEERQVIGDIFRFGIKLEEAADYEELTRTGNAEETANELQQQIPRSSIRSSSFRSSTFPETSESSVASGDFMDRRSQLICGRRSRRSSILNYIIPSVLSGSDRSLQAEEDAISKAATSFIQDGFEKPPVSSVETRTQSDSRLSEPDIDISDLESVSGVVGQFIVDLLRSSISTVPWKLMASLARLLLQDFRPSRWDHSFNVLSERLQSSDLETFVPHDFDAQLNDRAPRYMAAQIACCKLEIIEGDASLILDLVLLLLQRLEEFLPKEEEDVPLVCVGLLGVSMIVGVASGRIDDLMAQVDEDSCLKECCVRATTDSALSKE